MRAVLIGNYGVGNFGDEALKEYFLSAFPEVEWQVVSACPAAGELPRLPGGLRSLFSSWWKTLKAIKHADGVVFGGGSLFTDAESVYACFLWWLHAEAAYYFGRPVHFAFQGIGPFRTRTGEWFARRALRKVASISVRDEESFARVQEFVKNTKIVQTFDPIYLLFISQKKTQESKNVFTIIPRHNSGKDFFEECSKIFSNHTFTSMSILSFQPNDGSEKSVCALLKTMGEKALGAGNVALYPVFASEELMQHLSVSSAVLTQRFHGALAGLAQGTPELTIWSQKAGDKLDSLSKTLDKKEEMLQKAKAGELALALALGTALNGVR